jgi:hypothetical protein
MLAPAASKATAANPHSGHRADVEDMLLNVLLIARTALATASISLSDFPDVTAQTASAGSL